MRNSAERRRSLCVVVRGEDGREELGIVVQGGLSLFSLFVESRECVFRRTHGVLVKFTN